MGLTSSLFSSAITQVIGELSQELRRNLPPVDSAGIQVSDSPDGLNLMMTGRMVLDGRERVVTLPIDHLTLLAKIDLGPDDAMRVLTHTTRRIAGIMKGEMSGEQIEQLMELRGTDLSDADAALDALEKALDV